MKKLFMFTALAFATSTSFAAVTGGSSTAYVAVGPSNLQGAGEVDAALLRVRAGQQMGAAAADVVLVFRDVGQVGEVGERAHHRNGLLAGQDLQHAVQFLGGAGVGLAAEARCESCSVLVGADVLAGCFTIAMTAVLLLVTFLSGLPEDRAIKIFFFGSLVAGLVLFVSKIQVTYGRIHLVWMSVGIYVICLLISLPAITYRPPLFLYFMALLSPLIGLLILNTSRFRLTSPCYSFAEPLWQRCLSDCRFPCTSS